MHKKLKIVSLSAIAAFLLSSCSANSAEPSSGSEDGFEYGAAKEEVEAVLNDHDPVTLQYQAFAPSENDSSGIAATMYKDYIEERSGGKITVDIIWGQAVADYQEVDDALVDGRLDLAYTIPGYFINEYPTYNELMAYSALAPNSPLVGELATSAMLAELTITNDVAMAEFEEKGLHVITPMYNGGEYYFLCNEDNTEVAADDWPARSVRAGSELNGMSVSAIGANPVSIEHSENFEALQRGTVDCLLSQFATVTSAGIPEVAPNISNVTDTSFSGRGSAAHVGGSNYESLPLPYKQIIFDAEAHHWAGWSHHILESKARGIEQMHEANGRITSLPSEVEDHIAIAQSERIQEGVNSGVVESNVEEQAIELADKWSQTAEELDYKDSGSLAEMNDWYSSEADDFLPFANTYFEEVLLEHRPS